VTLPNFGAWKMSFHSDFVGFQGQTVNFGAINHYITPQVESPSGPWASGPDAQKTQRQRR
jgi:hypothetical protein